MEAEWSLFPVIKMGVKISSRWKSKRMCTHFLMQKLQLAVEQSLTGGHWNSPTKDTPCPKQRRSHNKMAGGTSIQSLSHVQLCDPMDCSMTCLPVHQQLAEFTQTHLHWVGDAIQPFHPLLSPFPPTFNLSQHQGLFKWVRRNIIMIKSNPIPARWVTHKLETNNTEEILSLLWRFWAPHQASQTEDQQMN